MDVNRYENIKGLDNLSKTNKRIREIIFTETDFIVNKKYKYCETITYLIRDYIGLIIDYNYFNIVKNYKEYKFVENFSNKIEEIIPYLTKEDLYNLNHHICSSYLIWIAKPLYWLDEKENNNIKIVNKKRAKILYDIIQKKDKKYNLILNIRTDILKDEYTQDIIDTLLDRIIEWVKED
jgi:hypothetical protein